ncbi:MAG: PDZ domain-containing protein [Anaerolineales bacterium]
MSTRGSKPKPVSKPILKQPWIVVTSILFSLLLAVTLFFLFYGVSPEIDSHVRGNIGISMETNSAGEVVLYPKSGMEAEKAGVQNFDILLKINGMPAGKTADISKQLNGQIGQPLTITVRKSDGSEKTYTLVRSSDTQKILDKAGLSVNALAAYLTGLSLLVGLGLTALGTFLILRHPTYIPSVLTAFVLVLLPFSLNAVSVMVQGVTRANLEWLYSLLRAAGLFLTSLLVLVFPNGQFVPKWMRWCLIGVGIWAILYAVALIDPAFLAGLSNNLIWIIILALGLSLQVYRYQRISSEIERQQIRRMGIVLLVALVVYLVVWLLNSFLPTGAFSQAGWVWFYMIAELLVDATFLFFGIGLLLSIQKTE